MLVALDVLDSHVNLLGRATRSVTPTTLRLVQWRQYMELFGNQEQDLSGYLWVIPGTGESSSSARGSYASQGSTLASYAPWNGLQPDGARFVAVFYKAGVVGVMAILTLTAT